MSTHSQTSKAFSRRIDSLQRSKPSRPSSIFRKRAVSAHDGYMGALRVAYLAYLLQPRARRTQHVPQKSISKPATSIQEVMKDFSLLRDSKSTKFPHGFMEKLRDRLSGVITMQEKKPEYNDAAVRRSFAAFFNAFTDPAFQKQMERDRRVEDLVLIFYSNAAKELQKGKPAVDDSWKLMADRHVALFLRLVSLVLKTNDWSRERPELATRLATLESKLLAHDRNLAADSNGTTVEVVVPLSYDVKDMPLVQTVARLFGLTNTQIQSDVDKNKPVWTPKAALQDLKKYQTLLNLDSRKTLRSDDFDVEEGYEAWKKAEAPELSQLMLAIVQTNPELAKSTNLGTLPQFNPSGTDSTESNYYDLPRRGSELAYDGAAYADKSSYLVDQPADMSVMSPSEERGPELFDEDDNTFTFIPSDPRAVYRIILATALTHDLKDDSLPATDPSAEKPAFKLLSKQSLELLHEISLRWRIPYVSRMVLFLDVIREKFMDQEISLETLDAAFDLIKEPQPEHRRNSSTMSMALFDRTRWTLADFALNQHILTSLHEALLRDLYDIALQCYEPKPPSVGPILYVLEHHIYEDPSFSTTAPEKEAFANQLRDGLKEKAFEMYKALLEKTLPQNQKDWEFFHVIELGKVVMALAQRIQKRYRKNPEIMGVNPFTTLVEIVLPLYGEDARDIVSRILQLVKSRAEEVPIEDGFDLYKELSEIRSIHAEALPGVDFAFKFEDTLADFVWRWIHMTEASIDSWVEGAVKQDQFKVRTASLDAVPTEEERHSVSVIDIFSSFNQTIDRIAQLQWDDDFQYAKFMTALAKIVGMGISKYCELVEARFAKEMDRLTPEQEAAANQSRQEKWMQLAKDAWSNKDKIEPFQFFPESFVKLNNIEFATHQLDKLEKEANVEACVEAIERNAPPLSHRQRKINNYVFSIKIVEAEDLRACDLNGLSDPYVVLGDEYQKRLAKTRIIHGNLNPRWDETVDITTQGPLNVIATVWDWDTLGDHDCVGRTSIKLDPSHFGDFMPREYWLDLDTQGRLLLRVSMEGERDDIQFYFGKAFRTLKRTERDMTRKITDKLSAYINHCLSTRALRSLLSKGINLSAVSSYFNRNRPQPAGQAPTQVEIMNALKPLLTYFDDNFAIMNMTLTKDAMVMVMARLWKEVLATIESLVVPPLSDKPSQQRQLNQQELDIVFKWLQILFDFFHAVDDETGVANGVPLDVLRSPKYFDIKTLNFFYFDPTDALVRTSERMASATAARQQQQSQRHRVSAPPGSLDSMQFGGAAGLMGMQMHRKSKSILLSRNLGTMRKAKDEKRKEAQADPNDDMILRILRMRPEAERYLKDRSRQKERLAAAAAAEMIVRQSIMSGGGRMTGSLPRR